MAMRRPAGFLTKAEAAERLGMSTKTLERRMKREELLSRVVRIGKRVLLPEKNVEAYLKRAVERGYL